MGSRTDVTELGTLAQTIREALEMRERMKADGATWEALDVAMERTVRAAWPKGRETAWMYLCPECRDYGLIMHDCPGDATCGRPKPHLAHDYGTPCWCDKGRRFKERPKSEQDFTQATKSKPPTRWGR